MMGRALKATVFIFAVSAAACGLTDVGKPLSVELSADPEAASVGDTVSFSVAGTGSFMSAFRIDYDDGSENDQFPTGGSQEASTTFSHAYGAADTYSVVATVFDSSGQLSDTLEIVIEE